MISGPVVAPRFGGQPKQLVVLLHGYGADGEDLIGLSEPLGEVLPDAMFVSPNAPTRCAQNSFGYEWFPIAFGGMEESIRIGAPTARQVIAEYLDEQWRTTGLGPSDTFLVGFSQGAMMALHLGLSLPEPVLGIVAFSGALIPPAGYENAEAPKVPVCLIHGEIDPVVDPVYTHRAAEWLNGRGYAVSVRISPGLPHGISADGLQFAAQFLAGRIASATA